MSMNSQTRFPFDPALLRVRAIHGPLLASLAAVYALLLLTLTGPAQATDGVAEINHTCADLTGCFSGDNPGYPVTIDGTAGRSYRLTSNLIVPNQNTDGILISTTDIGIDLNSFAIIRFSCEGATTNCTPVSGIGGGVISTSISNRGISVKNGSIVGMGTYGVFLGQQAEVSGLRVRWNRFHGIHVGSASTVSGNTASNNGVVGIFASFSSTVSGNTAYSNGANGILASNGSTVSGNTVRLNGGDGILALQGSTVSGNTSYNNGSDGIQAAAGSKVSGNMVSVNSGYGLNLSPDAAYGENVIASNTSGTVNSGVNLFSNSCSGNTICP